MDLVCVGNALMDLIAFVDGEFIASLGFREGETLHVEPGRLEPVLARLPGAAFAAGGGAANTARTAALLGLRAAFFGSVGRDARGELYRGQLLAAGVDARLGCSPGPTGVFCALLGPAGGRTILVAPGAALDIVKAPLPPEALRAGGILYLEGFLLRDRDWFLATLEAGRAAGMGIALDLGSRTLVRANRDFLLGLLPRACDYVFANEDEFLALADAPLAEGLALLGGGETAYVVKLAERGAIYARRDGRFESPVRAIRPVDETGAGDAFAAGFLSGLARGLPPERCLRLGNRIAEEVLGVPGLGAEPARIRAAGGVVLA